MRAKKEIETELQVFKYLRDKAQKEVDQAIAKRPFDYTEYEIAYDRLRNRSNSFNALAWVLEIEEEKKEEQ